MNKLIFVCAAAACSAAFAQSPAAPASPDSTASPAAPAAGSQSGDEKNRLVPTTGNRSGMGAGPLPDGGWDPRMQSRSARRSAIVPGPVTIPGSENGGPN